jgi:hypothetical protein
VVVDSVDVDAVVDSVSGLVSAADGVAASAGSFEFDSVELVDDDSDEGVSAHATPHPYPVATATPTPRATAKPPTRPT